MQLNPDAQVFSPGGVDLVHNENMGYGSQTDETESEEARRVIIGSEGLIELGSEDEGFHSQPGPTISSRYKPEVDPFIPEYWRPYSPPKNAAEADFHHLIGSENQEKVSQGKHYPLPMGFELFIKSTSSTPFKNGDIISFYIVDELETIFSTDIDNSTLSQVIGSSPTQDGISVLLTPEVHSFVDSLSNLPESLRVIHATEDTPYTRVYGLTGFELKSDPNYLSPQPHPSISIESYLLSGEVEEDKQKIYVPSYGFIGFGIDQTLSTPSPDEVSQMETSESDNLRDRLRVTLWASGLCAHTNTVETRIYLLN
ncbi:unnamed protein product [Orchesella dallaii]|uniref:Uncharacterized protein n=1 Tax=Orchesella dallaii TaxID=48710 RepID=A0ABP1QQP7_9HEXA